MRGQRCCHCAQEPWFSRIKRRTERKNEAGTRWKLGALTAKQDGLRYREKEGGKGERI